MISSLYEQNHARMEIKHHGSTFYAVLTVNKRTLGISETFNSEAAAILAGKLLVERYKYNLQASHNF